MSDILRLKEGDIDAQLYQAAVRSLNNGGNDGQRLGRWMVNFLTMA
jgi:hypothetical protein